MGLPSCYDLTRLDNPAFYKRQVEFFERIDRKINSHLFDAAHRERAARLRTDRALLEYFIYQMSGMETEARTEPDCFPT
jgi:hypothetical protein